MMTQKERKAGIRLQYLRSRLKQDPSTEETLLIRIVSNAIHVTPDGKKAFKVSRGQRRSICKALRISVKKYKYAMAKLFNSEVISIYSPKGTKNHEYYVISKDFEQYCIE